MGFHPVQSCKDEWREAKEAGKELWQFTKTHEWKKSARKTVQRKYWSELVRRVAVGFR